MRQEIGYLGLGSNVGDRRTNLQATVELLWAHGVDVLVSSSVYETEPVGEVLDQRAFYNACLRVETRLRPEALLDACKAVERAFGRVQAGEDGYVKDGPRAIDVDVLLLGDTEYASERLTLPHRQVTSRRFVLVPLLEIAPELEVPGYGRAADALAALQGQEVRRAGPPLEVGP
jgi:2-amino-4-hydroxy-6-hydroxymethyldihydropteridine diphosphokinase